MVKNAKNSTKVVVVSLIAGVAFGVLGGGVSATDNYGSPAFGNYWGSCKTSADCLIPGQFCRIGDKRCLTDADCKWANWKDKTNRNCDVEAPADVPKAWETIAPGEHWGSCNTSDDCHITGQFCRVGDKRCLTDADCQWANWKDKTDRNCDVQAPAEVPKAWETPAPGEHWGSCKTSDDCHNSGQFCRAGDKRCMTDADCKWANWKDKTNRNCDDHLQAPAEGPKAGETIAPTTTEYDSGSLRGSSWSPTELEMEQEARWI